MFMFKVNGEVQSSQHNPVKIPNLTDYTDAIEVPSQPDKMFREAWSIVGTELVINIPKAKEIVHVKRRAKRTIQFQPLDIEATIPSKAVAAEAARQVIRDADAIVQTKITNARTESGLRTIINNNSL